jgi:hypothetical protein
MSKPCDSDFVGALSAPQPPEVLKTSPVRLRLNMDSGGSARKEARSASAGAAPVEGESAFGRRLWISPILKVIQWVAASVLGPQ